MLRALLWMAMLLLSCRGPAEAYLYPHKTPVFNHVKSIDETVSNTGLNLVDCIYVINLDARADKWQLTLKEMKERGLNPLRFSAINGWKLSESTIKECFGPYEVRLTGGQFGCLLSHLSLICDADKKGYSHIWVCEDDIQINEPKEVIDNLIVNLSSIDPEWDLLFTDPDTKNSKGENVISWDLCVRPDQPALPLRYYRQRIVVSDDLMRIGQRFGTYSFVISQRGINKILDYFSHVYLWSPIDIDIFYIPDIRAYAARRDIVTVNWKIPISDTETPSAE